MKKKKNTSVALKSFEIKFVLTKANRKRLINQRVDTHSICQQMIDMPGRYNG